MSQLKQITFSTIAGGEHTQTLRLQHYTNEDRIEHWKQPDKALSGKLRHNIRGTRGHYKLSYDHSTEASEYRSLLNNIITDLNNGEDSIILSEGTDLAGGRVVVPTETFKQQLEYVNQITGFMPALEFVDNGPGRLAGSYVEVGYVQIGYVE